MIRLLVLSAGTSANYHLVKIFKEKFNDSFYIIGVDINESYLIPSINYLDNFYKVPESLDPSYKRIILNLCKKEQIDVILPSFDIEQKLFYRDNIIMKKFDINSLGIPQKTLKIYDNKEKMMKYLYDNDINIPRIFPLYEIKKRKNYFVKPKNGVASVGAREEIGSKIKMDKENKNFLIQEICQKPEITLECFYYNNTLSTVARERIEVKSGVCIKARIYYDQQLHKIAQNFVKKVDVPLYFNLQFMKNSLGELVITDVNFRLAGGMSLSYAAGWDEASAIANVLLKKPKKSVLSCFNLKASEQFVVRAYTDIVTKTV